MDLCLINKEFVYLLLNVEKIRLFLLLVAVFVNKDSISLIEEHVYLIVL